MKDPSAVNNLLAARYYVEVDALAGKVAAVAHGHRHLQHLLYQFFYGFRAETPQGSRLACAPGDVATRIPPITEGHSLFPAPLPAPPLVSLTASLPSFREERYGLTTFHKIDKDGLGALCPLVALCVHDKVMARPCTRSSAFWPKPLSIFGLFLLTTFIKSSHVFTIPSIQPPLHLMLADTPFPRGAGVSRVTVGTLFVGIRQRVTLLPYHVGYC